MSTRVGGMGPGGSDGAGGAGLPAPDATARTGETGKRLLGEPATRRFLVDFVKRRVPASDVDDVVQTVLCDALVAATLPDEREELRRWLTGVARHKVADLHRKGAREAPAELPEQEASPAPLEARAMVRWAEEQAASTRDAAQTLDWMAREGEGEKLETIAEDAQLPAARVRQRVSRLRRWMKQRWLAELAAVAALAAIAFITWRLLRRPGELLEAVPAPEPRTPLQEEPRRDAPSPLERARLLRREAAARCGRAEWQPCLDRLDEAAGLDAEGDRAAEIQELRGAATRGLTPPEQLPRKSEAPRSDPAPLAPTSKSAPAPRSTATPPPVVSPKQQTRSDWDESKSAKPVAPKGKPKAMPSGTGAGAGSLGETKD